MNSHTLAGTSFQPFPFRAKRWRKNGSRLAQYQVMRPRLRRELLQKQIKAMLWAFNFFFGSELMKFNKKHLHQFITALPGLFVVAVLFLSRQIELALLILVFDIVGAIGGVWWLHFSKKLAHRAHTAYHTKGEGPVIRPAKIALIAVVVIIALAAVWGIATVAKTIMPQLIDPNCVAQIQQQEWIDYGQCLDAGSTCISPLSACG